MNGIVSEWVEKAEGDFRTAEREMRAHKAPNYDAVCFHAQQCAEKYLKAFLVYRQIPLRPLHDLYAVDVRYPGEFATREEARAAIKAMRTVRAFLWQKLGLP